MSSAIGKVLHVGVVGAGAMGSNHAHTLSGRVSAAQVTSVFDSDSGRATAVAAAAGAQVAPSVEALIDSPDVDAVVVASPDSTHADLAIACLAIGKPVLCEKPLAESVEDALRVVEAEVAGGRRLLQV